MNIKVQLMLAGFIFLKYKQKTQHNQFELFQNYALYFYSLS